MSELYYQDNILTLYKGDCRHMAEIPDDSVHCCVTSPPYLSKRKYKTEPLIWGAVEGCPHEWGNESIRRDRGALHGPNAQAGNTLSGVSGVETNQGQFCQLCGAWRGHLGLEPSPELFIAHLLEVFREVKRVLRTDGICWVNMGDSHAGSNNGSNDYRPEGASLSKSDEKYQGQKPGLAGLHPGDLMGIPWRFALAMQADGWHLHQDIIWDKPSCMPESVNGWRWTKHQVKVKSQGVGTSPQRVGAIMEGQRPQRNAPGGVFQDAAEWVDCPGCPKCAPNDGLVLRRGNWRPTVSHEYIFMFSKGDHYWADREAVKVKKTMESMLRETRRWNGNTQRDYPTGKQNSIDSFMGKKSLEDVGAGANLRSVWKIGTESFAGPHFATFPTELPTICIKASTSERGVCPKCNSQWARIIKKIKPSLEVFTNCRIPDDALVHSGFNVDGKRYGAGQKLQDWLDEHPIETLGWRPTCQCNAGEPIPALVLDPFAGTFTTGLAAVRLGRRAVGYELSEAYCNLALSRNRQMGLG